MGPASANGFRGKRLFLSIDIPDYLKESLAAVREKIKGFHWVDPDLYHLTLKFIGDVPGQYQDDIIKAIDRIEVRSFFLPIQGLGAFPPMGKSHAVWAGLGTGHPHLFQLHKKVEDYLFQIGYEPEKRIYHPHITLARVNHAAEESVKQFLKRHPNFGGAPFKVESFHLLRSEQIEGRRRYAVEHSWNLL